MHCSSDWEWKQSIVLHVAVKFYHDIVGTDVIVVTSDVEFSESIHTVVATVCVPQQLSCLMMNLQIRAGTIRLPSLFFNTQILCSFNSIYGLAVDGISFFLLQQ